MPFLVGNIQIYKHTNVVYVVTVTLLPCPEGVTVGGDICIEFISSANHISVDTMLNSMKGSTEVLQGHCPLVEA